MLADVFVDRYQNKVLGTAFEERHRRFFVQMAKLIGEQVFVRRSGGERRPAADTASILGGFVLCSIREGR